MFFCSETDGLCKKELNLLINTKPPRLFDIDPESLNKPPRTIF
jgi:hypothetical protein